MKNEKLGLKEILYKKLQSTVTELNADFSAIAFYDPINLEFRWRLAIGSLNQRYTSIVVRSGKGIAGRTLKTKREFIITRFPEELQDEAIEFPILIIEELKSAVAVPLLLQNQMIGVLMIGQRSYREFGPNEVSRIKEIAEEMLASYIQEREVVRPALEDKKENQKSVLSSYFIEEKTKRGDKIKFILLDQRITLLPGEIQQSFISIFQYLFDFASWAVADSKVKVVIERKSEQQFSIEINKQTNIEIPPDIFSCLADKVRQLKGSIEVACDNEKTVLTMNFFLNLLLSSKPWDSSHH